MAKKQGLKAIENDVKRKYNKAVQQLAEDLSYQIEEAYETVIEKFYNNYDPISYNRTYSTYLASSNYNSIFDYKQVGDLYTSGIDVSSSFISGKPYRADTDWVFNRTFIKGIHGFNRNTVINRNKKKYGDEIWKIKHVPKNMSPAPKVLMDKEFKRITKKSNIDNMFKNALESVFV